MRLDRLDLVRYGHFTETVIDFPRPAPGAPDLHVIYGPNEAGKSTLTQAWLDLLYGIPHQSRMNFLHDHATLRLGARLALPEGVREIVRRKGTRATLADAAGHPLPEALIAAATGGIDREAARAMFTLDDETIERGGEAILESRGELGRLLFAATAGLTAFGPRLAALRERAEAIFRPRAQKSLLAGLRRELESLDDRRRAIDIDRARHAALAAAVAEGEKRMAAAAERLRAAQAALAERQAEAAALPLAAERAQARAALAALGPLPEAPPGAADFAALRAALAEGAARITALEEEAAAAEAEAAAIIPDPAAAGIAPALAAAEALKGAHDEALKDIPRRRVELAARRAEAERMARELCPGRSPETVAIGPVRLAALRARLAPGIRAAEAAAAAAREAAASAAALAAQAEAPAPPPPGDTAALETLLARLQARDPVQAAETAARAAARAGVQRAAALAALAPWQGDAAALAALALPPPEALDRLAAEEAAAEAQLRQAEAAAEAAAAELAAERAGLAAADLPTAEALAAARAAREAAWAAHRRQLDAATAEAFEAAMRRDDALTARRAAGEALALRVAAAAAAADRRARAAAARDRQAAAVRAALAAIDPALPDDWSAAALRQWAERRMAALEADRAAAAAEAEAAAAGRAAAAAAAALAGALGVDPGAGLDALMAQAAAALTAARAAEARAAERARLCAEAEARAGARDRTAAELAAWAEDWAATAAGTWLAGAPVADPAGLAATLDALGALEAALAETAQLAARIAAMERNRAAFAACLDALAAAAGEGAGAADAVWQRLRGRVGAALAGAARRAAATRRAAEARTRIAAARTAQRADSLRLDGIVAALGAQDAAAAGELLVRIAERDRLRLEAARLDALLAQTLRAADPEAAAARLAGLDAGAAAARLAEAGHAVEHAQAEAAAARSAHDRAAADLAAAEGGDAVARLVSARATVLEAAAAAAREHLGLSLGLAATEEALRLFRDRHRSGMLARASAAFAAITCGAYRRLSAEPSDGGDILVAEAADGPARPAAALSRGTRMQLYLALRVAGYHEIAALRPPMPFLGDDIMETFDDARAAATFEVLAGMARVGQVIYLTHHAHLCAIVAQVCPAARIHRLGRG